MCGGGHAWQGCAWQGACMAGGHAWLGGGMRGSEQILRDRVNEPAVHILLERILVLRSSILSIFWIIDFL